MSTKLPEPLAAYFAGHNNPEEVGELLAGGRAGFRGMVGTCNPLLRWGRRLGQQSTRKGK